MFPRRPFQTLIIQDDLNHTKYGKNVKKRPRKPKKGYEIAWSKVKAYVKLFMETAAIHGLNHLVAPRRQYLEIILWLTIIILSASGSLYLSIVTWERYQSSPTVISMDRDMLAWNTTFPAVTICPNNIGSIDKKKLATYLKQSPEANKTKLENFINGLANATYKSFEFVPEYPDISSDKYLELIHNLSMPFKFKLTIDQVSSTNFTIVPTFTEMGLCYAVNSVIGIYNSPGYRAANRWDILENNQATFFIHPLDGEVFAKLSLDMTTSFHNGRTDFFENWWGGNLEPGDEHRIFFIPLDHVPEFAKVYVHGPQEIPDITSKYQELAQDYYLKSYVTAITVYTSAEAATLSVNQRRCRFLHENNLKHNAIYTYTMCRMECRIRLCLKYCQCIPHFYRRIGDEKICDVQGLHCLAKYKDELYTLRDKGGKRINCACFPLCDDVNYVLEPSALQKWILGTSLQWGMVTYPRTRYRRDIIFGFTDVLVAVGSMAGLFLGCCVLSFMEIIYYLTLRLICYSLGYRSDK